ncbi:MAG: hypothetical protein KDB00_22700 [Planctomycetales bacterium]|nr:hypothetical protein [Planctomycetales bacterium]
MSEIISLARLSVARSRTAIRLAILYFVVMHLAIVIYSLAGIEGASEGAPRQAAVVTAMAIMMSLPLIGITFGLFDFTESYDFNSAATGYMPWLLRTPIKSWKLAAVPIALKTIWVLVICSSIAGTTAIFGTPPERWFIPAIGLGSLFILACLVTWHPFRGPHTRLVLIAILFVPAYAWMVMSVSFAFANKQSDMPTDATSVTIVSIIALSTYVVLTGLCLRAVRLARMNVSGQIKESHSWLASDAKADGSSTPHVASHLTYRHAAKVSPLAAVLKYDLSKLTGGGAKIVLASWCLIVLFWSACNSVAVDSMVGLGLMLMFPAIFLNEWMIASRDGKFLPSLLAVAPIPSSTLAWTRQCFTTAIWFASLSGVPLVMTIWHFTGASRDGFGQWDQSISAHYAVPDSGWRIGLAISIVALILVIRQTTWNSMAHATGNPRHVIWSVAIKFGIAFVILSYLLVRFMRFPNWDAWSEAAWEWIAELPVYLPWILAAKLVIVAIASAMLYRSRLTQPRSLVLLMVGYALATILCATIVWKLIPSANVYLWHCIAAIAALIPYSRIALAPLVLARNRHH